MSSVFLEKLESDIKHIKESSDVIYINDILKISNKVYNNIYSKDTLCWNCCHKFDNNPVFLPINYRNNNWIVRGYFCSFNCAKRFALENNVSLHFLQLMHKQIYGTVKIQTAPKKWVLHDFGGTIDIETYRQSTQQNEVCIKHTMEPILHQVQQTVISKIVMEQDTSTNGILNLPKKKQKRKNPLID